ncbi:MAG: hypothetical protein Q9170_007774, partial [Blastenia crenularia]
ESSLPLPASYSPPIVFIGDTHGAVHGISASPIVTRLWSGLALPSGDVAQDRRILDFFLIIGLYFGADTVQGVLQCFFR